MPQSETSSTTDSSFCCCFGKSKDKEERPVQFLKKEPITTQPVPLGVPVENKNDKETTHISAAMDTVDGFEDINLEVKTIQQAVPTTKGVSGKGQNITDIMIAAIVEDESENGDPVIEDAPEFLTDVIEAIPEDEVSRLGKSSEKRREKERMSESGKAFPSVMTDRRMAEDREDEQEGGSENKVMTFKQMMAEDYEKRKHELLTVMKAEEEEEGKYEDYLELSDVDESSEGKVDRAAESSRPSVSAVSAFSQVSTADQNSLNSSGNGGSEREAKPYQLSRSPRMDRPSSSQSHEPEKPQRTFEEEDAILEKNKQFEKERHRDGEEQLEKEIRRGEEESRMSIHEEEEANQEATLSDGEAERIRIQQELMSQLEPLDLDGAQDMEDERKWEEKHRLSERELQKLESEETEDYVPQLSDRIHTEDDESEDEDILMDHPEESLPSPSGNPSYPGNRMYSQISESEDSDSDEEERQIIVPPPRPSRQSKNSLGSSHSGTKTDEEVAKVHGAVNRPDSTSSEKENAVDYTTRVSVKSNGVGTILSDSTIGEPVRISLQNSSKDAKDISDVIAQIHDVITDDEFSEKLI